MANSLSSERGSGGGGGRDRRCTFSAIKDEGLGTAGAPTYITVRLVLMTDNFALMCNPLLLGLESCLAGTSRFHKGVWGFGF